MEDRLFRDRVPEAAARQLATVLASATEEHLATLEGMQGRKSTPKRELAKQTLLCAGLVAQCEDLGVNTLGLRGARCARLEKALAERAVKGAGATGRAGGEGAEVGRVGTVDAKVTGDQPNLTVVVASYPETNGKRNWTALLRRADDPGFRGLVGNAGGIPLARGELWNRVAYAAECAKYLIGERATEPFVLDYGDDKETPEGWPGEKGRRTRREDGAASSGGAAGDSAPGDKDRTM